MDVALAIVIAVGLVAATVLIHHEVLRATANSLKHNRLSPRRHLLIIFGAIVVAHFTQVLLYAVAFYVLHAGGIGAIGGGSGAARSTTSTFPSRASPRWASATSFPTARCGSLRALRLSMASYWSAGRHPSPTLRCSRCGIATGNSSPAQCQRSGRRFFALGMARSKKGPPVEGGPQAVSAAAQGLRADARLCRREPHVYAREGKPAPTGTSSL